MLSTMKKLAVGNQDLFEGGHLTNPCAALEKHVKDLGWESLSKLTRQNRTLALAALVNAHRGGATQEKLKRFRRALVERSGRDPVYEQYIRVLSRYPVLRHGVLIKLHAKRIISYEKLLREKGQKASPSLIEENWTRVI